jgi:cytochrome P450
MRPRIEAIAAALLDRVAAQGHMELIADYAFPLPITVIAELLGVPIERQDDFRRWSDAFVRPAITPDQQLASMSQLQAFAIYMQQLVAERRKSPQEDLISRLIQAEEHGDRLSPTELLATSVLLVIAGHETSVNLIGSGMLLLLQVPDQRARLQQHPSAIKGAVEEIVRYVNPVQGVNRYAADDLAIGGVAIPKGSHVVLVIAAANHDPAHRVDADELDVSHTDKQHLAFGHGIHYCLGAPLARLEGEIAFTTLLQRLPHLRLAVPETQLAWRPTFDLRGLRALPVAF